MRTGTGLEIISVRVLRRNDARRRGYLLTEVLVYIGLLVVILAFGYQAMERCIDASVVLRRNADDITRALNTGERWRADVRSATRSASLETTAQGAVLHLLGPAHRVDYRFADEALYRRFDSGPWVQILDRVKASAFQNEQRPGVAAWRWELELQPRAKATVKASRIRPLFTFLAAPAAAPQP